MPLRPPLTVQVLSHVLTPERFERLRAHLLGDVAALVACEAASEVTLCKTTAETPADAPPLSARGRSSSSGFLLERSSTASVDSDEEDAPLPASTPPDLPAGASGDEAASPAPVQPPPPLGRRHSFSELLQVTAMDRL